MKKYIKDDGVSPLTKALDALMKSPLPSIRQQMEPPPGRVKLLATRGSAFRREGVIHNINIRQTPGGGFMVSADGEEFYCDKIVLSTID